MRIPRLYTSQSLSENQTISLSDEATHYLKNVLRMKSKRELVLFNGEGGQYHATIESVEKKGVSVAVGEYTAVNNESPLELELGVCIIKNDAMDWLIQKAVELGVTRISPLFSDYTDVKLSSERLEKKQQHWQQIAIHACEQCGRAIVPVVSKATTFDGWSRDVQTEKRIILHPYNASSFKEMAAPWLESELTPGTFAIALGPEGGFSDEEVGEALNSGFMPLSLGPRILRAETAPLAILPLLQSYFGDY
ncbi:MAG: 16S rRNA (uracil(1498)-N(3))-methyltransferase [Cellvibrionaceae bacterium]